jgi:sugar phosphate isomerase/epimerase
MLQIGVSLSPNKSTFGPLLFSGDLERGLENAKNLGYSGVELSLLDSDKIDQQSIIEKTQKLGLKVYAIATGQTYYTDGYSLYSKDQGKRDRAVQRLRDHIDFAAKLASTVIIGGIRGRIDASAEEFARQSEGGKVAIKACVKYAEKQGVTLLIEPINRYETNVINNIEDGVNLIQEIGSENLKLLPDTFHMNIEERSFEESIVRTGSVIGYVHFADNNRMAPGWGHIDFSRILSALKKVSYAGPIGIEVLPKPDDFRAAEQAVRYLNSISKEMER